MNTGTVSMEYDVDTESCKLRVSLDKFLKQTIELQRPTMAFSEEYWKI